MLSVTSTESLFDIVEGRVSVHPHMYARHVKYPHQDFNCLIVVHARVEDRIVSL
jgi:hypothetical protein